MSPIPPNSIEQAQMLYQALTNQETHLTNSAQTLVDALRNGENRVLVELPWGEVRDGERHDRHEVIITRMEPRRIFFVNALKSDLPVGSEIDGLDRGPARRVEAHGEESMDLIHFVALFAKGGKAMLRN